MSKKRLNQLVRNLPVARFHYKGKSHNNPVRRVVLVTQNDGKYITGFEVREGKTTRSVEDAPIKKYLKNKIATREECRPDSSMRKVGRKRLSETTLVRESLTELTENGA
jgi:ribosomal protein S12